MRDGWVETTLGEVAEWFSGGTPKAGKPEFYDNGSIPWVVISDMLNKEIYETASQITPSALKKIGGRLAPIDSVLISMYATVGRPAIARIPVATNQAIAWSVPNTELVVPDFLLMVAESLEQEISSMARGATQRNINRAMLREFVFQLPPLVEQRRIVDVVESVDNYITALQARVGSARIARNAVLHELLNAGGDGWVETALGEVARIGGGKRLPKGTPWSSTTTRHRYIRATDIHDGHVDEAQLVYVPDEVWPTIQRFTVQTSDVIITIAGTIGQLAIIEENLNGVNLTENAAFIRCVSESCIPDYILLLLSSYYGQSQIRALTVGTTQMKLGLERIASIKVVAPPLVEQQRIVEIVSSMDDSIRATEQTIVEAKNLRSGLLSDLLSGEHEIPESYDKLLGAA